MRDAVVRNQFSMRVKEPFIRSFFTATLFKAASSDFHSHPLFPYLFNTRRQTL